MPVACDLLPSRMRRLIAALGLLSFANLMVLQASGVCPISGGSTHGSTSASTPSEHTGHEGHAMAAAAEDEALQQSPASESSHAPDCLTMGPCALTLDVRDPAVVANAVAHPQWVAAGSDRVPSSLTTSPELPPPRA
jgi:hypothetical protein